MIHARTRIVSVVGLVVAAAGCAAMPATVDPLPTINVVREKGCSGRRGADRALRSDPRLDRVAARLTEDGDLADAIAAEKYPAARSTLIHIARAPSEAALTPLLATRFCTEITDVAFETIGVASRGGETWVVLAAPFRAPQVADRHGLASRARDLVNAARARPRVCGIRKFVATNPVTLDATLGRVAEAHAQDMARHRSMSHTGSDGSSAAERVTRAGYAWRVVAENVASGQTRVEEVVQTWLESPGHCANLMNPDVREMGMAFAFDASSDAGTYWVQVLAARR